MKCLGEDTKKWISVLKERNIPILYNIQNKLDFTESDIKHYCSDPSTYANYVNSIRNVIVYTVERSKQFQQFQKLIKQIKNNISNIDVENLTSYKQMESAHMTICKEFERLPKKRKREIPHEYICPITLEVMIDPVICSDGQTYERSAITHVLKSGKPFSPITREKLKKNIIIPNMNIKKLISQM